MRKIGIAVLLIVMAMGMLIPAAHASSPTSIFTASVTAPPSYSATNTSITVWVNDSVGFRDYALQVIFYGQNLTGMSVRDILQQQCKHLGLQDPSQDTGHRRGGAVPVHRDLGP